MLPIKDFAPKVFMAVNNSGRQLAQRLGWVATSYCEELKVQPLILERASIVCDDRRPDWRIECGFIYESK